MRQKIAGLVAGVVLAAGAAPVQACTALDPCGSYGYYAYGAGCGNGWGCGTGYDYGAGYDYDGYGYTVRERLPDPTAGFSYQSPQYYYVNQGPTYTGPGNYAPFPTYQERAVSGWPAYDRPYYYGYNGGPYANASHHYYNGAPGVSGPLVRTYHWGRRHYAHRHYRPHRAPKSYYATRSGVRSGHPARRGYPHFRQVPGDSLARGANVPMKPHTYKF
ncbi:hypothetical protein V1291_004365 [Nitrobacteraceae bacterium AZCC 1564]